MTHDLGDRADPATPVRGRWRLLLGDRRLSRATPVAPVDETTVDLTAFALQKMLDNAENHILRGVAAVDAQVARTRQRNLWAGLTQDEMLTAVADMLLEIRTALTGKAT